MPNEILGSTYHLLTGVQFELLLFCAFWFTLGALDELAMDLVWLIVWVRRRLFAEPERSGLGAENADGARLAVFIPAWREAGVIGHTIRHALQVWTGADMRLYLGCYGNDPDTVAAASAASGGDPRLRIVIHDRAGPTTKADCLNRIYRAMCEDERRSGRRFLGVVLHDAEDMVHPCALDAIASGLRGADFVQLPVLPEPQPGSPWVGGHYMDEFAEAHGKTMVVRDALGAAIPAAGVGCGFRRERLDRLARSRAAGGEGGPFASECLTEDYELGMLFSSDGAPARFLRLRDQQGRLIATRAFFPADLAAAVRQKTRWVHGIAFQSWDRLGWSRRPLDVWMALRDRRGPLTALVLAASYAWLCVSGVLLLLGLLWPTPSMTVTPVLQLALAFCLVSLIWRMAMRFAFTTREYGPAEGLRSLLRIFVGNVIAMIAGRRALVAYIGTLRGRRIVWDKTEHSAHPAVPSGRGALAR